MIRLLSRLFPKRELFEYKVQGRRRFADPAVIRRKLNEALPTWADDLNHFMQVAARPLPASMATTEVVTHRNEAADECMGRLAVAVSAAFGLAPLGDDGQGYSEAERLTVLALFLNYCGKLLEDTRPLASSVAGMDSAAVN